MSERGVFAMDQGIFEHPTFAPEPFTEREAWMWLIAEAAFVRAAAPQRDHHRHELGHPCRLQQC
jgi:hypothetical protein